MKRILCLVLTLTMLFTLAACGSQEEPAAAPSASTGQPASVSSPSTDESAAPVDEIYPSDTPESSSLPLVDESSTPVDEIYPSDTPEIGNGDLESDATGAPLDLTALSSTMVYAEVYNIMMTPEDYVGRQITMEGLFYTAQGYDENGEIDPDVMYFVCIIQDATACCAQGIEFVLADESAIYPEDYPAVESEIIVTGEFQVYTEHNYTYYHLINATMEVKGA